MSWISLEQLIVPVALTSFMVALSLMLPGAAQTPGFGLPQAPAARPSTASPASATARLTEEQVPPLLAQSAGRPVATPMRPIAPMVTDEEPVAAAEASGGKAIPRLATQPSVPAGRVPLLRAPVDGPLLRGYEAPASPYGPGHRGVDIGAAPGAAVLAPAPGRVRFAGQVGGTGWVSIEIAAGVTVSVGPITAFRVRAGDDVGVRSVLGEAAAGHGGGVHLGVRVGGAYVDPQPYLARFGPARLVPLGPSTAGTDQPQRPAALLPAHARATGRTQQIRRTHPGAAMTASRHRRGSGGTGQSSLPTGWVRTTPSTAPDRQRRVSRRARARDA